MAELKIEAGKKYKDGFGIEVHIKAIDQLFGDFLGISEGFPYWYKSNGECSTIGTQPEHDLIEEITD